MRLHDLSDALADLFQVSVDERQIMVVLSANPEVFADKGRGWWNLAPQLQRSDAEKAAV